MDDLRVLKALRRLVRGCNLAQGVKGIIADESGAIALIMAFALTAFLGIGALTVDYGYMSSVQGELKKAAEAGALAGANALGKNADWNAAATSIIQENQAAGQLLTDCQVLSGYWSVVQGKFFGADPKETPSAVQAVQVVVAKTAGNNGGPLPLSFAPILGIKTADLSATAVAVVKPSTGVWSILETGNGTVALNNHASVVGSVGVNGNGPFNMEDHTSVEGKAYLNTKCEKNIDRKADITEGIQQDSDANSILKIASQDAKNEYDRIDKLEPSKEFSPNPVPKLQGGSYKGVAKENVLDVTTFSMTDHATLQLYAPAGGSFVIRFYGTFALRDHSDIKLTGDLTPDKVTFVNMGGNTMRIDDHASLLGSILSPKGAINASGHSSIDGVLVSGMGITLDQHAQTSRQVSWLTGPSGSSGGGGAALVQ